MFVTLLSPIIIKEKLTTQKLICIAAALLGMVFVSGVLQIGLTDLGLTGIIFGVSAAVFYASVILLNKFLRNISAYDSTIVQLAAAALILLPYTLLSGDLQAATFTGMALPLLLVVGIIHTGFAYALYFSSMSDLDGQTIAIFSYIDPAAAVLLSVLFLKEPFDLWGIIGAVLILGSTLLSEVKLSQMQSES